MSSHRGFWPTGPVLLLHLAGCGMPASTPVTAPKDSVAAGDTSGDAPGATSDGSTGLDGATADTVAAFFDGPVAADAGKADAPAMDTQAADAPAEDASGGAADGAADSLDAATAAGCAPSCPLAVAPGPLQTYALTTDGHLRMWGQTLYSGLKGEPPPTNLLTPQDLPGLEGLVQIHGDAHFCAVTKAGKVYCWGQNSWGGVGVMTSPSPIATAPLLVAGADQVVQVACGSEHTVALRADGTVLVWGMNLQGQLGDGGTQSVFAPKPLLGVSDVAQVSATQSGGCALLKSGMVSCWGGGNPDGVTTKKPSIVVQGAAIRLAGDCVQMADSSVACNINAGMGFPTTISGVPAFVDLAAAQGACGRTAGGDVWCWGANDHGQAGYDSSTCNGPGQPACPGFGPHKVAAVSGATGIFVGWSGACATTQSGALVCWGRNDFGQAGIGTMQNPAPPTVVPW